MSLVTPNELMQFIAKLRMIGAFAALTPAEIDLLCDLASEGVSGRAQIAELTRERDELAKWVNYFKGEYQDKEGMSDLILQCDELTRERDDWRLLHDAAQRKTQEHVQANNALWAQLDDITAAHKRGEA